MDTKRCNCPKCRLRYRNAARNAAASKTRVVSPGKEGLRIKIAVARSAMQVPALNLGRANVGQLKRIWRETREMAKAQGLIE